MSLKNLSIILMLVFAVSACGDLNMNKKKKVTMASFSVCKMDVKRFSKIFTERIDDQLKCLEENLHLFIEMVKTDKPGYLSLKELKGYVDVHFKNEIDPEILEMMDQVFSISALMFGEDPKFISKESVSKLIDIFDFVNEQLVSSEFYKYFKDKDTKISFAEHNRRKAWIFAALTKVGNKIAESIVVNNNPNVIDITKFLKSFHSESNKSTLEKIEKLLFVKKIFLGGHEGFITAAELKRLGNMFGDISKIAFDLWKINDVEHLAEQQEEIINTLKSDIESLLGHFAYSRFDQVRLFTIYNIFDLVEMFAPEFMVYTKYKNEMLKVKEIFLESRSAAFTPGELYMLVNDLVLKNLKLGSFFFRAFRLNKDFLKNPNPLNYGIRTTFYMNQEEKEFKDYFNQIVKNYQYFKGAELAPLYSHNIRRSAYGMVEIAIFENIAKKIMAFYGDKKLSAKGGYSLTLEQITHIVHEFKNILVGEGIMRDGYLEDSAKSITLIATLFQSHSDGDGDVEVDEFVDFMITVYSAFKISGLMTDRLKEVCRLDEKGRFTPVCFRRHFKSMMHLKSKQGRKIADHFPKLFEFLMAMDYPGRLKFYTKAEKFTRTCTVFDDGSDVPMNQADIFMIFGGIIAIEQTFIRFDVNNSNLLDPNEVDNSYGTYAAAVKAIIPSEFLKKWSKDFYLYLMKYEKVPEVENVGFFRAVGEGMDFVLYKAFRNKQTTATRNTLATVLRVISEKSKSKVFPCETLR